MANRFECVQRGSGPIDEAFGALDDTRVQFLYIKFPIGSGTFTRTKFVYVHFIGPSCGVVKRGKWNAELPNALALFQAAAGIEVTSRDALSFDSLVTQLKKVFVSDDGSFSLQKLREEYNRRIAEGGEKPPEEGETDSVIRKRKLAVELGLEAEAVLKAVREDLSPFNWAAFEPSATKLKLFQGGSGGLFEMAEVLPDNKVLFGLLRVAVGTGRFRRVKLIFFQWSGDSVGAVAKGKVNIQMQEMSAALAPHSTEIRLVGKQDLDPKAILEKLQSVFIADHIQGPDGKPKKAISEDEYIAALKEEQLKMKDFYNEPEHLPKPAGKPSSYDVEETLKLIRKESGGFTWGVFQPK